MQLSKIIFATVALIASTALAHPSHHDLTIEQALERSANLEAETPGLFKRACRVQGARCNIPGVGDPICQKYGCIMCNSHTGKCA